MGSDTRGIEEIILATVAIVFVNEIDEALYEHALPELYKTAHDRDRFNLENWIPAEEVNTPDLHLALTGLTPGSGLIYTEADPRRGGRHTRFTPGFDRPYTS